jgi:hypothetical protein
MLRSTVVKLIRCCLVLSYSFLVTQLPPCIGLNKKLISKCFFGYHRDVINAIGLVMCVNQLDLIGKNISLQSFHFKVFIGCGCQTFINEERFD